MEYFLFFSPKIASGCSDPGIHFFFCSVFEVCGLSEVLNSVTFSIFSNLLVYVLVYDLLLHIKILCELFADNSTPHTHHTNLNALSISQQESFDGLLKWTETNRIALHPDKSKCMLITTRQTTTITKQQNKTKQRKKKRRKTKRAVQSSAFKYNNEYDSGIYSDEVLGIITDSNLFWIHRVHILC